MYESHNTILAALAIVAFVPFSYQIEKWKN